MTFTGIWYSSKVRKDFTDGLEIILHAQQSLKLYGYVGYIISMGFTFSAGLFGFAGDDASKYLILIAAVSAFLSECMLAKYRKERIVVYHERIERWNLFGIHKVIERDRIAVIRSTVFENWCSFWMMKKEFCFV